MSTNSADDGPRRREPGRPSVEELARRQGVRPIASVDELARDDVFESDEELDEFLAFIQRMRHSDVI
jgi:hypothetical protein